MSDSKPALSMIVQDVGRIAIALEKIQSAVNPPTTNETRIAALKRISNAVIYIDEKLADRCEETMYRQLMYIRKILLKD